MEVPFLTICGPCCCAAYAGMTVAQQASQFASSFFGTLLPVLRQWLINAQASYTAMTSLLSEVPAVGAPCHICLLHAGLVRPAPVPLLHAALAPGRRIGWSCFSLHTAVQQCYASILLAGQLAHCGAIVAVPG